MYVGGITLCFPVLFISFSVILSFIIPMQVKFREFIPSILHVARQCLASGEEDVAVIAFEIFDELIESPAPLLGESVKSIVQFSLEVCSSQKLESNTRHQVGRSCLCSWYKALLIFYLSHLIAFTPPGSSRYLAYFLCFVLFIRLFR